MCHIQTPLFEFEWYPTLLRTPKGVGLSPERILPGAVSDYFIEKAHDGWLLVISSQGGLVYFGPGPVSVVRSPAPF